MPNKGVDYYLMLLIIWKSDLSERTKWDFFQAVAMSILFMDANKTHKEKGGWELQIGYVLF